MMQLWSYAIMDVKSTYHLILFQGLGQDPRTKPQREHGRERVPSDRSGESDPGRI